LEFIRGDLEAAETTAKELLTLVRDLRSTRPDAMLVNYGPHFMNIRFTQGRIDELLTLVAATQTGQPDVAVLHAVRAMITARAGQLDEAGAILGRVLVNGVGAIPPDLGWYTALAALGDTAHVVGDVAAAHTLAAALTPYAGRYVVQGGATVSQPLDVTRAELALTLGDSTGATEIAANAAAHARLHGAPIFTARALVLEAAGRKELGQPGEADIVLAEALAIAERTGARIVELDAARLGLV
jgi:hypothetical protein